MEELMVVLSDNIRRLQAGEVAPASANALATSAGMIFRGVKLQLEYARLTNRTPNVALLNPGPMDGSK
jgi:hypothetical protein